MVAAVPRCRNARVALRVDNHAQADFDAIVQCLGVGQAQVDATVAAAPLNERIVGKALADVRGNVVIGTKLFLDRGEVRRDGSVYGAVRRHLEASLERLKTDYERTYSENKIDYKLYFEEFIANSSRRIPFSIESTGNHQLIKVLCCILSACLGGIIVLDEADSGIHDLLFQKIIKETEPLITGQLILSTHNTLLMESDISQDSIYVITEEPHGHKSIRCINDYQKRTYLSNNIRNKYLNNEYGGLPEVHEVDFRTLLIHLSNELDKN